MDDQNRRLLLATVLSMGVLLIWYALFPPVPTPAPPPTEVSGAVDDGTGLAAAPPGTSGPTAVPELTASSEQTREEALAQSPRIAIDTPRVIGSISLIGGRIDDLALRDYRETVDPESPLVTLLSPAGTAGAYYALFGWTPTGDLDPAAFPGALTEWTVEAGDTLSVGNPVTLAWDNGAGLVFRRTLSIDDNFMFNIEQSVENAGDTAVRMAPYGVVARHEQPQGQSFWLLHEGVVRASDGETEYIKYDDMPDMDYVERERGNASITDARENGWIGFTDKYWMTTLIAEPGTAFASVAKYAPQGDIYQTELRLPTQQIGPGESVAVGSQLFAGAKEWATLRAYQNDPGPIARLIGYRVDPNRPQIDRFVDAIDWGWFWFLTKPIFTALHYLKLLIGNMGWAIIGLTLLIKVLLFPLAYKSYASMARMKELQPEMEKLKERAGDDRQKLQMEMMELYKKEKVNPAAGCLPILFQIPIFFSLYKVIFVTIELRHAPWFGPFRDLSAPDPTSIFNMFGLLPWGAPAAGSFIALILIGILPLLLGITMWLQMKLNPAPTDPTQAMIFNWMPWVFMFMLGGFASGLVLYWISNNVITFAQQYTIMRSHGYKPDVFGNIKASVKKPKATPESATADKAAIARATAEEPEGAEADADGRSDRTAKAEAPAEPDAATQATAPPAPTARTQSRRKKARSRRRKG
jgi:YidC/Oxa1 family membrane protein insertase